MRIALVILHGDPSRGGAERYTFDLAAALRGAGHEAVTLASSFGPSQASSDTVTLGTGAKTRVGQYLRFLDDLDRHLAAHSYDVVHAMLPVRRCDVYHPHAGIAADAIANGHLKYQGPVLQVISQVANRMNRRRQRFAAVERELLTGPHPPVVISLSDYVRRVLTAHYTLAPSRLATLFNATDLRRFDPTARPNAGNAVRERFGIAADRVVALMIAQDFHRKGLAEAICALAKTRDPRLVLLVIGKQDPSPYRNLSRREGVENRVVFAGKTEDPYAFYRASDLFLLPTRHDPCSLVVLESLAMGVPVISTVFNGACEIMLNGVHGFVLPDPSDIDALAESLRAVMDDSRRNAMSAACLALRPRLAYERHLSDLLSIYETARVEQAIARA